MVLNFFSFWVESIWGSSMISLFGTAVLFALIGILGKWSYILLFTMMMFYFLVFGVGFYGIIIWLPAFLFAVVYFFIQIYRFIQ